MARDTIEFGEDGLKLHRLNMRDEWLNGAYDESGDGVICDLCGSEMKWADGIWECRECGQQMNRATYFNHIGAEPPSDQCLKCNTNYPLCKKWCDLIEIDPDDPMLG